MNKKLIQKRLIKTKNVSRRISRLPFVRSIILNGSLASGIHKESSDIDILIIAKNNHVFTARFFINFYATLFKIKRVKNDTKGHAGKFCFNYFLTENYLKINFPKERESYCAKNYSDSLYIAGDYSLFQKFIKTNTKLFKKYGYTIQKSKVKSQKCNSKVKTIQRIRELIFGIWFEKWAKNYQIKKIESDPITKKYPESIVYNDRELRFHPPKG